MTRTQPTTTWNTRPAIGRDYYSWDEATFTWDSTSLTWDTAYINGTGTQWTRRPTITTNWN